MLNMSEFVSNKKGDKCTIGTLKLISRISDLYMVQFKQELISNQLKELTNFTRARHIIIVDKQSSYTKKNLKQFLLSTEIRLFITIDIGIYIKILLFQIESS